MEVQVRGSHPPHHFTGNQGKRGAKMTAREARVPDRKGWSRESLTSINDLDFPVMIRGRALNYEWRYYPPKSKKLAIIQRCMLSRPIS
jgi:hypothetical protein